MDCLRGSLSLTKYASLGISRFLSTLIIFSAVASAQFKAGTTVTVGNSPVSVVAVDLTGDGHPDLADADYISDTVTLSQGNGTGGFTPGPLSPFFVGIGPRSIAVGDFNGDKSLDLAVANQSDGTVTVLLNGGTGVFTATTGSPITVGSEPTSIAVGDFNGDGKLDLAISDVLGNSVTVLQGDGTGAFTAAKSSPFAVGKGPRSVAVGDFNGDSKLDLAVANATDGTVTILLGDGTGGFAAASGSPVRVGSDPQSVAVGDFNKDGKLDLAIANFSGNTVTVLLGNGKGGFTQASGSPLAVGSQPVFVTVGDFNGDGKLDLVIADSASDDVTEFLGDGTGGFSEAAGSPFTVGTNPEAIAVADLNGDGKPDLAVANSDDGTLSVLLNIYSKTAAVVVSAASGTAPVAPGSIVSIYGTNLATSPMSATMLPLPTNLGGTSVSITDSTGAQTALPLFYAGPTQINAEIPHNAKAGGGTLTISAPSGTQTAPVTLAAIAPGLFSANQTGAGVAAAQFVSDQANGEQTTVDIFQCSGGAGTCEAVALDVSGGNTALVLYGTGIQNRAALSDVTVTVGSRNLPATYAGAAPNYAGEDQLDVLLPSSLAGSGVLNVYVTVAGTRSNVVTVQIQ